MKSSARTFTTNRLSILFLSLLLVMLMAGCTRDRLPEQSDGDDGESEPVVTVVSIDEAPPTEPPTEPPTDPPTETATPEPTETATPAADTVPYTVQPGDTVSTIGEQFDTSAQRIRELNYLTTDALQVGQVLRVPYVPGMTGEGLPTPTPAPMEYVIEEGDTLYSIALEFDVPPNDIVAENTISDPNNLSVGQTIVIPGVAYQSQAEDGQDGDTPSQAGSSVQHTVAAGETLSTIAENYGVTSQAIIDANGLSDPNQIQAGQSLTIPNASLSGLDDDDVTSVSHTVGQGETLFSIARSYEVDPQVIIDANSLSDPSQLQAGQTLVIPGLTAAQAARANQIRHVVQQGETLFSIALQYGITTEALMELNDLEDANFLQAGDELIMPRE